MSGAMQLAQVPQPFSIRPPGRRLELGAAIGSGLFAGALMAILLLSLSVWLYDEPVWKLPRMVAATVLGAAVLEPAQRFDAAIVATALAAFAAASAVYGVVLAGLAQGFRGALAPWIGLAAGAALHALHVYGFATAFPWLAELRSVDTLAAHLVFGLLAAQAYADRVTVTDC